MAYGMGTVFGALVILLLVLKGIFFLEKALSGEKGEEVQESIEPELVAVIATAIEKYLEEERIYRRPHIRLEIRKPSSWKISSRSED